MNENIVQAVRRADRISAGDAAMMIAAGIEAAINGETRVQCPVPHADFKIRITDSMIDAVRGVTIARGSEQIREIITAVFHAAGFEIIE